MATLTFDNEVSKIVKEKHTVTTEVRDDNKTIDALIEAGYTHCIDYEIGNTEDETVGAFDYSFIPLTKQQTAEYIEDCAVMNVCPNAGIGDQAMVDSEEFAIEKQIKWMKDNALALEPALNIDAGEWRFGGVYTLAEMKRNINYVPDADDIADFEKTLNELELSIKGLKAQA